MQTTFIVHVEDQPGVLTRVTSLIRRRGFNIESLTVGHTERAGVSRMTIVMDSDQRAVPRTDATLRNPAVRRRAGPLSACRPPAAYAAAISPLECPTTATGSTPHTPSRLTRATCTAVHNG